MPSLDRESVGATRGDASATLATARGLADSFDELYRAHVAQVERYLVRRVGEVLAEELTAQTFEAAWAGRDRFDPEQGPFRGWVFGIATNLVSAHYRAEERALRARSRHGLSIAACEDVAVRVVGSVDAKGATNKLAAAIAKLSHEDRSVLLLCTVEELSYAEVAAALSIPVGTVRSRLSRVRDRLAVAVGLDRGC